MPPQDSVLKTEVETLVRRLCADKSVLAEEVYAEIEKYARLQRETLILRTSLRRDPYGRLGNKIAKCLAARLRVIKFDSVRSVSESRISAEVLISQAGGNSCLIRRRRRKGQEVRLIFDSRADKDHAYLLVRIASLSKTQKAPSTLIDASTRHGSTESAHTSQSGFRLLYRALAIRCLDLELAIFFLLSCISLYDNENGLDDLAISSILNI